MHVLLHHGRFPNAHPTREQSFTHPALALVNLDALDSAAKENGRTPPDRTILGMRSSIGIEARKPETGVLN